MASSKVPRSMVRMAAPGQSKVSDLVTSALLPFRRKKTPVAVMSPMGMLI